MRKFGGEKIHQNLKTQEEILTDDKPDHLHPNVKKYWLVTNLTATILLVLFIMFPFIAIAFITDSLWISLTIFIIFAISIITISIVSIIFINKIYKSITFLVRDEALTINKGILIKQSQTIPFNRVQNVDIYRGPLERRFKIATIFIQTAGWGGNILRGRIQGIENPELLRDIILKRVTRAKNNGL